MLGNTLSPKSSASRSSLHSAPPTSGAKMVADLSMDSASTLRVGQPVPSTRSCSIKSNNHSHSIHQHGSQSGSESPRSHTLPAAPAATAVSPKISSSFRSPKSALPDTFTPSAAPIPASLKEKNSTRKALKLPVVSNVVDAVIQHFRIEILSLHLHEPNSIGFHVDGHLRFVGTGPLKAKVFFPQGVSLSFRLPSHEQLSRSASAATYTATDPALASANSQRSPNQSSTSGQNLNAGAEAGLHPSPSLVSVSSGTPKAGDRSSLSPTALKASSVQGKDRRSAYKLGSSKSSKKLHTSASSPGLSSSGTRASFVSDIAPDPPSDGAHSKHKYNTGDLGEGKLFTIPAHLEPVKIKPLGDIQARIRIEAKGPELSAISALVNKVIRTHGMVKAVLRGEGVVVKAYGLKVAAKPFEKDIAFEGLSHLTNVIRFDPTHPGYGLAFGSPVSNRATLNSMLSSVDNRDARRSKFGDLAASGPNQQLLPSALPQHAQRGQKPAKPYSPYTTFVQDLVILSGSPERGIEVAGKVNLPNPSNITVDLTSLEFDLCVPASTVREATGDVRDLIPIGIIHLEPTRLASGDNWIEASGRITLPTLPPGTHPSSQLATILLVGKQFFSGIFENRAMPLFILTPGACSMSPVSNPSRPLLPSAHRRRVCAFPWLADALEGVMIEAVLPAQGERVRLLDSAEFRFEVPGGHMLTGPPVPQPVARTVLKYGLGVGLTVHSINFDCIAEVPVSRRPSAVVPMSMGKGSNGSFRSPTNGSSKQSSGGSETAFASGLPLPTGSVAAASGSSHGHATQQMHPISALGPGTSMQALRLGVGQMTSALPAIEIPGTGEPVQQTLPVQINPDLRVLIAFLRGQAMMKNISLGSTLNKVFDTFETGIAAAPEPVPDNDPWENLAALIASVCEDLRVRAVIEAEVSVDGFHIPGEFRFEIADLPIVISAHTCSSLIPHIARPIVDDIMQRMTLQLDHFVVNELSIHGIHAQSDVRLINFGPMRSEVRFREGLELMLLIDGRWTRCGTALIADMITVDPYALEPVQSDVFVVPLAGQAGAEAFSKFVEALVQERSFSVYLTANQFSVRTGGVNFLTPIHKAIALEGMNGLRGLTVDDIEILGEVPSPADAFRNPNQKDALRIKFKTNIPNQSSINLALARITLYMMYEGVCVGDLEVDEIQLRGKHVTHADGLGTIYIGADDQHETRKAVVLEKIGKLFSHFVAGEAVELDVRGRKSWAYAPGMTKVAMGVAPPRSPANRSSVGPAAPGNGLDGPPSGMVRESQRIAWLDAAVRTICLPVQIKLPEPLMIVKQIDIGNVIATLEDDKEPVLAIEDISAIYELPYSISLQILSLSLDIELMYRGEVLGSAVTEESTASDTEQWRLPPQGTRPAGVGGRIKMNLSTFTLHPNVNSEALAEAIAIVADQDEATHLQVRGMARVRAQTALGRVLAEIQLGTEHTVSIRGLKGLRSKPLQHADLFARAATQEYISLRFALLVYNPSPRVSLHVVADEISFGAYYKKCYVGRAIIRNKLLLDIGHCRAEDVEFRYQPAADAAAQVADVPANLMSGRITELWIQGDEQSTTIPTLLKALQTISVPFLLQPLLNKTLIGGIATRLSVGMLTSQTCLAEFSVNNPLGVPINILDLNFRATHRGEDFATCSTSFRQPVDPVTSITTSKLSVPPGTPTEPGQITSPLVETQMAKRIDKIVGTLIAEKGLLYLDIELEAQVDLGTPGNAFPVPISYSQSGLPLKIRGLPGLS